VRGRAGFHADETWRQEGKEGVHLLPVQLLPQDRIPRRICGVGHEMRLAMSIPTGVISHMDGLLAMPKSLSAFGTLMPGAEAIHPIMLNDVEPQAYSPTSSTSSSISDPHRASTNSCHGHGPKLTPPIDSRPDALAQSQRLNAVATEDRVR
jgi:hypothetical protein